MAKKLKWGTIDYLNQLIDEYFEIAKVPNIAGLELHLKISEETWKYYTSERWRTHRKSDAEIEVIEKDTENKYADGIFEDWIEIDEKCWISEKQDCQNIENGSIKELVSATLKNAKKRIENYMVETMVTAKNPAGAIFYSKAALGYRETTPAEGSAQAQLPTKITINVLPAPTAPAISIEESHEPDEKV
jgi:hypothetical protein